MSFKFARLSLIPVSLWFWTPACGNCPGTPSCFAGAVDIVATNGGLVSASGCGTPLTTCSPSCSQLSVAPPPDGGTCDITIQFQDGHTTEIAFDWGAVYSDPCCGKSYAHPGERVVIDQDAN